MKHIFGCQYALQNKKQENVGIHQIFSLKRRTFLIGLISDILQMETFHRRILLLFVQIKVHAMLAQRLLETLQFLKTFLDEMLFVQGWKDFVAKGFPSTSIGSIVKRYLFLTLLLHYLSFHVNSSKHKDKVSCLLNLAVSFQSVSHRSVLYRQCICLE